LLQAMKSIQNLMVYSKFLLCFLGPNYINDFLGFFD
jgi:hypothetical protein